MIGRKRLKKNADIEMKGLNLSPAQIAEIKSSMKLIKDYKRDISRVKRGCFNRTISKNERGQLVEAYKGAIKNEEAKIKRYQGEMV